MVLRALRKLFGGAPSRMEAIPDRVWLTREAKLAGIRRELREQAEAGASMIALVAHFPDVLEDLRGVAAEYEGAAAVRALRGAQLTSSAAGRLPVGEADLLAVIVAERHPLASVDDALADFARALPSRSRIVHHVSLEDAVMRSFGSGSLRTLLDRLGATEDEPISHPMVTRSIRRAQERMESRSGARFEAASAAEWIERNVRR
jgi:hypothetical protein